MEFLESFHKHKDGTITLRIPGETYRAKLVPDSRCPGCTSLVVVDISDRRLVVGNILMEAFCWDCSWIGTKEELIHAS